MSNKKPRKRMTFKERKEADLINALEEFHEKEEKKQGINNKEKKENKDQSGSTTVVYVDGENMFYQLFDQLRRKRLVRYREDFVKFDVRGLLEEVLSDMGELKIRYYGTKLQEVDETPELLERTQRMISHKNRWVGYLSNQDIDFVEAGRLVIRNKGTKNEPDLTFEEKGIDVTLAVDIVDASIEKHADQIVLWSSDSDFKPAIHVAEKHGTNVVYLTHEDHINDVLSGSAKGVRTFTSKQVVEAFKRAN